jgi:NADP-dependent aldehyde dehydrogenase
MITTTNPRTGETTDAGIEPTTAEQVAALAAAADTAFPELAAAGRVWRAGLLDALAKALEDDRERLVETADAETGLGLARVDGELTRSVFQFRIFAEALREGGYLEVTIDHAGASPMGPVPDVRRMLVPIGPVGVFGASNFPFAFSVAGGDTASALAAGCPVILKAHSSHPLTSKASFEALSGAADAYGAPAGTLGIVYGTKAGGTLVADPRIKAVGFTGSLSGGQALLDIIHTRDEPIPFYGELSSLNPLIITEGAAAARGDAIAAGLFASFTGSGGQMCTKPGVAFVPRTEHGDRIVQKLADQVREAKSSPLLNSRITSSFGLIRQRLIDEGKAEVAATGVSDEAGIGVAPSVLTVDAGQMTPEVTEEAFGPLIVIAYYDELAQVERGLQHIPKSLTATIHSEEAEADVVAGLADRVRDRAGRLIFNGYPTGVRVSWAQHHGGPWPATNSQHTSVGVTAIRRFLRPFVWQDAPEALLPEELRDGCTWVPRRVDGVLQLAQPDLVA